MKNQPKSNHPPLKLTRNRSWRTIALALLALTGWFTTPGLTATYQYSFTWTNRDTAVDLNLIERSVDGGAFTSLANVGPVPASYVDTGLAEGIAYSYRVRSHSAAGYSDYSNTQVANTPPLLTISSPADYQTVSQGLITGTARGANGLQSVTVNGKVATISGTTWSVIPVLTTGTNTLTVVATDNSANRGTATKVVRVVYAPPATPVANFAGTPTSGQAPLLVNFTDTSTGPVSTRLWTFGDGTTSSLANPTHTYATGGVYSVKLEVTGSGGSAQLSRAGYINVTSTGTDPSQPVLVVASPSNNQTVTAPNLTVSGTAVSPGGIKQVTVAGHAATINGTSWSTSVTLTPGTNTLMIVFMDNTPEHNTAYQTITVVYNDNSSAVAANFSAGSTSGTGPLTVNFTDTSTGSITSRTWDFGDGTSSTAANPAHTYTAAGVYSVTLFVSGPGGSAQLTRPGYVTVTNPAGDTTPPTLTVVSPVNNQVFAAAGVTVTGTVSDPSGIKQVTVGGRVAQISGNTWWISATLNQGTNVLAVVATDNSANNNTASQTIRVVYNTSVAANFSANVTSGTGPLTVNFTDASSGSISSRTWSFGDGTSSTVINPSHTYASAGVYAVTLVVTGPGGTAQLTRIGYITVTNSGTDTAAPVLAISNPLNNQVFTVPGVTITGTVNDPSGIKQITVGGKAAQVSGNIWWISYTLASGLNNIMVVATDNSPNHNVSYKSIQLTLNQTLVAKQSLSRSAVVSVPEILDGPVVNQPLNRVADITVVEAGQPVGFHVTANDPAGKPLNYSWDFGDGQTGFGPSPEHSYGYPGCQSYTVQVVVDNGITSATGTMVVATTCQLNVQKLQMNLNFAKDNADRCTFAAALDAKPEFNPAGQRLIVDIGQAQAEFQLDENGRGTGAAGQCRLVFNKSSQRWVLTVKMKGSWRKAWSAYNLVEGPLAEPSHDVVVPVTVVVGQEAFAAEEPLHYSATSQSGTAK